MRRGATKDRPTHLKGFPGPRRVGAPPAPPFFSAIARRERAAARPAALRRAGWHGPRARLRRRQGPFDFGAAFPRAAFAPDAPELGAARLGAVRLGLFHRHKRAAFAPPTPRIVAMYNSPLFFFPDRLFHGLGQADQNARIRAWPLFPFPRRRRRRAAPPPPHPWAPSAAQETKTGSNRKGKRKRKNSDKTTREGAKRDSEKPRPKEAATADGAAVASQETKNDKRKEKNKGNFEKQGRRRVFPLKMPLGQ